MRQRKNMGTKDAISEDKRGTHFLSVLCTMIFVGLMIWAWCGGQLREQQQDIQVIQPIIFNNSDGTQFKLKKEELNVKNSENIFLGETLLEVEKIVPNGILLVQTDYTNIRLFLDQEELFSYGLEDEKIPFGKTMPHNYHYVKLPDSFQGKMLTVAIASKDARRRAKIYPIIYGDGVTIQSYILMTCMAKFIYAIMILFLGMIIFAAYTMTSHTIGKYNELYYISLFAILAGIWAFGESRILDLITVNHYIDHVMAYGALMLMPIPLLMYFKCLYKRRYTSLFNCLAIIHSIIFLMATLLHVLSVVDYYENLSIIHIQAVIDFIAVTIVIVREIKLKRQTVNYIIMGGIVLALFSWLEILNRQFFVNTWLYGVFQIGVLIFILMLLAESSKRGLEIYQKAAQVDWLNKIAYLDALTQIPNRRAMDAYVEELENHLEVKTPTIIAFDINNLKPINDLKGHAIGDLLIQQTAYWLYECFKKIGHVFRTGGDEFIVIIEESNQELIYQSMSLFVREIQKQKIGELPVQVAYGWAQYDETRPMSMNELLVQADYNMYLCKSKQKEKMG